MNVNIIIIIVITRFTCPNEMYRVYSVHEKRLTVFDLSNLKK